MRLALAAETVGGRCEQFWSGIFGRERSRAPSNPLSPMAGEEPGGWESRERELLALLGAAQEEEEQWERGYDELEKREEKLP